ncbi:MAG: hypothetical protein RRY53_08005, partial [Pseudoflavonifractor sp.]
MKSILQSERECYVCGSARDLECHHIFGASNRKTSERCGFKVYLCHAHHNEPPDGVHMNRAQNDWLKSECQQVYEKSHTRAEFMALIGKN